MQEPLPPSSYRITRREFQQLGLLAKLQSYDKISRKLHRFPRNAVIDREGANSEGFD